MTVRSLTFRATATVLIASFLAFALYINSAHAAVSVDSTGRSNVQTATFSYTHTISTVSNPELVISIGWRTTISRDITSVTVNGSNASRYATSSFTNAAGAFEGANIWDFTPTTTGAQLIKVTLTGSVASMYATSTALNGVNQSTPRDGQGCNSANGTFTQGNSTVTTTQSGDYLIDALFTRTNNVTTAGTSQTGNGDHSSGFSNASYKAATTTGSQSMYWTWASSVSDYTACTAAYQPASSGTTTYHAAVYDKAAKVYVQGGNVWIN